MAKVWLITGSGNGLGRDIAEAALAAGDNVVAGARRTEELAPLVAQYGERVKPVTLEVRDEAAAKAAVRLAVDTFRRLDVLVNNAGYGQIAPFEQMSAEDFQSVVDTCFYGVVYTTRAAANGSLATVWIERKRRIIRNCARLLRVNQLAEIRQLFCFELLPLAKRIVHGSAYLLQSRE
jgi:NAD(P)-dependent dehydrogenase (short-subunit alcohol dehydrogenase family)